MKKILPLLLLLLPLLTTSLLAQEVASPFTATDLEGNRYTQEELEGKIVVLNFWFVQCKPCVMEMPELNELVEKYRDEDVVFLAFALNGEQELQAFLRKKAFDYRIIPDSRDVAEQYFVEGFPTHLVINQAGEVAYRTMGLSPFTVSTVDKEISELLKKG